MHYRNASVAALALILSACSTPQHTNLLIFGTNTVVGLKVGADATQTPAIQLAYSRQELVLMPLLANTSASNGDSKIPCPAIPAAQPIQVPVGCKFIGEGEAGLDSYSVLASFGANFTAEQSDTVRKAGGGIAQYFATGLAARALAENGGAAVVAGGEAAQSAAVYGSPDIQALVRAKGPLAKIDVRRIKSLRAEIGLKVIAASAAYAALIQRMDAAITPTGATRTDFADACNALDANGCAAVVLNGSALDALTLSDWQAAYTSSLGG